MATMTMGIVVVVFLAARDRYHTKLVTPPGPALRPGVVTEDMTVVASYREENGAKILDLAQPGEAVSPDLHAD